MIIAVNLQAWKKKKTKLHIFLAASCADCMAIHHAVLLSLPDHYGSLDVSFLNSSIFHRHVITVV